jgi:hypothetical protein
LIPSYFDDLEAAWILACRAYLFSRDVFCLKLSLKKSLNLT